MNFFFEDRAMDFHSLTRRQLQSLCKKNKIPANMTNVAMADALSSLATVEGIEDIGKSMPQTPLTTNKTTTVRKPVKRETDLVETSKAVASTPATRSVRRKATGTLGPHKAVCKIEEDADLGKEVSVVNHAYSTRRSTRLKQKSGVRFSDCAQKVGEGRNDAVKIELMSEEENEDTKSEVTSDVQQNSYDIKVEMVSVQEDNEGIESKSEVTSDVQQKDDDTKIEMVSFEADSKGIESKPDVTSNVKVEMLTEAENNEERRSQSEVTSEVQHENQGIKVEVLKEELDDLNSGNLTSTMVFVEPLVLEKPTDSEDSSSTLIMREVSRDNIAQALDGCTSEVSSAPMEEGTEQPKDLNEHQSMVGEDQFMEMNEDVEDKGAQDLELKFMDDYELSDVKVTEVKSESPETSNVDEGMCNLTSEVELYNAKGTEVCTSEVASAPMVSVQESIGIADVLSQSSLIEGNTENSKDENENQNMESENQSIEINEVEAIYADEDENSDVQITEVEAVCADGSSPVVVRTENLGNTKEVVELIAALDLESKFSDENEHDVTFSEVEDIYADVSSPMVKKIEKLEDSNVVVEAKATSDLDLKYVDEDKLGDIKVTEATYPDISSPLVERTENLEGTSTVAEVNAAHEHEFCNTNVTDVEAIYVGESSLTSKKAENVDDSNVIVELKATPDLKSKFIDENEATYADESFQMVEKDENFEDSNVVVEVMAAHGVELKFIDENELSDAKVAAAGTIYADYSSPMVEETKNLDNSNVDEGKNKRTSEASKAKELSLSSIAFDFESINGSKKEGMSSLKAEKCNLDAQHEDALLVLTEVEGAINDGSEIQTVGLEKSESVSEDLEIAAILDDEVNWSSDDDTSSYESEEDTDAPNSDTMEEMEDNELDVEEKIPAAAEESEDCSDLDISNAVHKFSISSSVNDPNVNETAMSVATPSKTTALENVVRGTTPLKSSTKKKAATTPNTFMIFNESKEISESGKLGVRTTSKVENKVVPGEENKGENTAQRKLKATSVRQLRKMIKQLNLKASVKEQVHVGKKPALQHNGSTTIQEKLQVVKRAALRQLSDNCLAEEKQK